MEKLIVEQDAFYIGLMIGFISFIVLAYLLRAIFNIPQLLRYQKAQTKLLIDLVENKKHTKDNYAYISDILKECRLHKDIKVPKRQKSLAVIDANEAEKQFMVQYMDETVNDETISLEELKRNIKNRK